MIAINNPSEYYEEVAQEEEIERVAIYARKSRAHEGEKDLQNHLVRLKARCELNEWDYTIYKEIVSGGNLEGRIEMQRLLDDCRKGLYDAVVVVDIDRLSRGKGKDLDIILGVFKRYNVKIVQESPYDVYDLNNTNQAQMLEMKMFFGNMELMQIKKRHKEGKRLARFMGKWVDGAPPYGYKIDRKTKFLIPDETEAEVMIKMKDYFLIYFNTVEVAWRLNKEGYRTRSGGEWFSSRVAKFLKNEVYTGTYIYNKGKGSWRNKDSESYSSGIPYSKLDKSQWKKKENNHQALFTKEEYQRIMKHFNNPTNNHGHNRKVYALSGLCVDSQGRSLTLRKSKSEEISPRHLVLSNMYKGKVGNEEFIPIEAQLVHESIFASIEIIKEKIANMLKEDTREDEIKFTQKKIDELKIEIEKIDNAIEKIQEGFIFGLYDANEGKQLKMKQEAKIEKLEEELAKEIQSLSKLSNRDSLDRLSRVNRFLEDVKNENDPEVLNKIYKNIISEIVIDVRARDEIDITVNFL